MSEFTIPGGVAGTLATLQRMAALIQSGRLIAGIINVNPRNVDAWVSSRWRFVPDGPVETIRTVYRLLADYSQFGAMEGDCDDAAVIAGALLLAHSTPLIAVSLVAVRSPRSPEFEHVFIVAEDSGGLFRVDPTAPIDADYTDWETLTLPLQR